MPLDNFYEKFMKEIQTKPMYFPISYNSIWEGYGLKKYIPKQVIFNNPATIIMWEDGTKTIVKCYNEEFDEEKGFAMAYLKKVFGGRNQYIKYIKNATRQEKK